MFSSDDDYDNRGGPHFLTRSPKNDWEWDRDTNHSFFGLQVGAWESLVVVWDTLSNQIKNEDLLPC